MIRLPSLPIISLVTLFFTLYSLYTFYPAISDFGYTALGTEDIMFFSWWFNHAQSSLSLGENPLFAKEVAYPQGIYLTRSTIVPLETFIYLLLPSAWGVLGRITVIQILCLILGGLSAFIFFFDRTQSLTASFLGAIFYNFSAYHLLQLLHHLNYALSFSLLPIFFLFYFSLDRNEKYSSSMFSLVPAALVLFFISLVEPTVVVMAVSLLFYEILLFYWSNSKNRVTLTKMVSFTLILLVTILIGEGLAIFSFPVLLTYFLPQSFFILSVLFFVFDFQPFFDQEIFFGKLRKLVLIYAPSIVYFGLFFLLFPAYEIVAESPLLNTLSFTVSDVSLLVIPPNTLLFPILPSYPFMSESGQYLTFGAIILLSYCAIKSKLQLDQVSILVLLSFFLAYPLVSFGSLFTFTTGIFSSHLFPLLNLLRVPSRFFMFVLLFLALKISQLSIPLLNSSKKLDRFMLFFAFVLISIEIIPNLSSYAIDSIMPSFYTNLSSVDRPLFLTTHNYFLIESEIYFQIYHHVPISQAIVSRWPKNGSLGIDMAQPLQTFLYNRSFVESNFGYIIFYPGDLVLPSNSSKLVRVDRTSDFSKAVTRATASYGSPVWTDSDRLIFKIPSNNSPIQSNPNGTTH